MLDRLIPFNNETIIAVSAEVKKTFFHYQKTKSPLIVIENGIDYRALSQTTAMTRDQLGLDPSHCIIGSVGRFAPVKRYPLLLQTFAHLYHDFPQARLLLVGAGPEEHTLRKQAAALGIADSIIWVINVPAAAYYSLMDIFILTSAKEGISIALLEAMSFSVACIITSATKHHPVIENMRNGIVVPHDNATLLLQKMAYLVMNDSVRKQLAKNAQQAVENYFNHHRMVTAYDRLFRIFNLNK